MLCICISPNIVKQYRTKIHRMKIKSLLIALAVSGCFLTTTTATPIVASSVQKEPDGVALKLPGGTLRLRVFSPRVIEVMYASGDSLPKSKSLSVISQPQRTKWKLVESKDETALRTDDLIVRINRTTGAVTFADRAGKVLLAEKPDGGKSLTPAHVGNINTLRSGQVFEFPADEAVYGLGQHPGAPM